LSRKRIAIACQGGGSHTAFTAGVLSHIARQWDPKNEFVGISGTSGGAICASLFWSAALQGDLSEASTFLWDFWLDNAAKTPVDASLNAFTVAAASMRGWVPMMELTPYVLPDWGEKQFSQLLTRHLNFSELQKLNKKSSPVLQMGAVEVLEGKFTVFDSKRDVMRLEMIQASAAIPNLFRAVEIEGKYYWDGLFSHNPPIVSLLPHRPDEVWVIQINPEKRAGEPRTVEEITDRRNELSGNLSLQQEISMVRMINGMLERGELNCPKCRHVEIKRIRMECDLNYASKLERSPSFIEALFRKGEEEAAAFLGS